MNITATPNGASMLIDCDECGPLGVVDQRHTHQTITGHLAQHGIESPPDVCGCGYDWSQVTGHPRDEAVCNDCDWHTFGMFADHAAKHHHLDTRHTWALTMGQKEEGPAA